MASATLAPHFAARAPAPAMPQTFTSDRTADVAPWAVVGCAN